MLPDQLPHLHFPVYVAVRKHGASDVIHASYGMHVADKLKWNVHSQRVATTISRNTPPCPSLLPRVFHYAYRIPTVIPSR